MTLAKIIGPTALVLAVPGIISPILGWLALALACVAALRCDRAFAIATVGVSAAGFLFMSLIFGGLQSDDTLTWTFIIYYSNLVLMVAVIGILLYPTLKKASPSTTSQ